MLGCQPAIAGKEAGDQAGERLPRASGNLRCGYFEVDLVRHQLAATASTKFNSFLVESVEL